MSDETREIHLRQWAQLAPGECEVSPDRLNSGTFWVNTNGSFDGTVDRAILLSALIVAVRARKWHYRLLSDATEVEDGTPASWHQASVFSGAAVRDGIAAEPCDALLRAYLHALKAVKEGA